MSGRGTEGKDEAGPGIDRREALRRVGSVPLAAGLALSPARLEAAQAHVHKAASTAAGEKPPGPTFFTPHEWATVRRLADLVIPADDRSGSATDALAPEFVDFVLGDPLAEPRERENLQTRVRGGLAWLDRECRSRFKKAFVGCSPSERTAVLDDIAWPEKARPEMAPGAAFFTLFRDLVASGFWSSRMGVEDLRYSGNTFVAEWKGCPPEVLAKIGL
ncbi:MAG TPA: gluconate 2-dehydrogenase subunit 3 family protein [Vicinamibacteria bacterium]|nr:gluconate 2-dehydrogenase subunit 3 family protein [Vicinamibacteria bacterium]